LGEVERPQAAQRPRTRGWGQEDTGADCSQVFGYEWDEVGRLTRARRWDVATLPAITDPLPNGLPEADLRYSYDATRATSGS
jgi:hypothetical protein